MAKEATVLLSYHTEKIYQLHDKIESLRKQVLSTQRDHIDHMDKLIKEFEEIKDSQIKNWNNLDMSEKIKLDVKR